MLFFPLVRLLAIILAGKSFEELATLSRPAPAASMLAKLQAGRGHLYSNIVDPHHPDADPDLTYHLLLRIRMRIRIQIFYLMRIRIRFFTLMRIQIRILASKKRLNP
jgi:hypothetical protein